MEENLKSFKKYEKVIIFGDNDVGKTSIVRKLAGKQLEFKKQKNKNCKTN